jgi:ligand-binding sensor domain-containing protein
MPRPQPHASRFTPHASPMTCAHPANRVIIRLPFRVNKHGAEDPGSLSDNVVRTMVDDREGTLWIGTYTSGLGKYDRDTEEFAHYQHDPNDPHSLSHNQIESIYEDQGECSGRDRSNRERSA